MPSKKFVDFLSNTLKDIKDSGLYKDERVIVSEQKSEIKVSTGKEVLNFCSNNYLGLCDNKDIRKAAKDAIDKYGFGLSSVRFICGTQDIHLELEKKICKFFGTEGTILFSSCFDANGAVFQALLTKEDAILTDALNHASIIDGIRLCKAQRYIFKHMDMKDLEEKLKDSQKCRHRIIATDGVFSMDGDIAPLKEICALAEKYDAFVFVDDSHATGFIGKTGRGTPELCGVLDKVDIITSTLGKAMGGATGGFVTGKKQVVDILRQRGRPYLFSNSVAPVVVGAALKTFDIVMNDSSKIEHLRKIVKLFRTEMKKHGFDIIGDDGCPIIPVMLYDAVKSKKLADELLANGLYAISFSFPVVPKGEARIRIQLSAAHTEEQVKKCINAFVTSGKKLKIIE